MELPGVIAKAHEIGYRGVELFGIERHLPVGASIDAVRACGNAAKSLGVEVVVLDTYVGGFESRSDAECEAQVDLFRRYLEMAVVLDCHLIRVNPGPPGREGEAAADGIVRFASWTARCADLAEPLGKDVVLENGPGMFGTVAGTVRVLEAVNRGNVGLIYDPGSILRADAADAGLAVAAFHGRIWNVRVGRCDREEDRAGLPVEGEVVDFRGVFLALKAAGYEGYLTAGCSGPAGGAVGEEGIAKREFERIAALVAGVWG
jgi:sugar phosphate isomerase/epimerase